MNILVIKAHPNPKGFTHKIAGRYVQIKKERGNEVKTINLYDQEYAQDFLRLDLKNKPLDEPKREKMQALISWADEIVFIFPLWWFDVPAILKNWFDQNFSNGFAFKYRSGKLIPEKLLKGKTSRIFFTAGGPTRFYHTIGRTIRFNLTIGRLGYVGIKNKSYTIFGNMNKRRHPEDREKMLEKVAKIARR